MTFQAAALREPYPQPFMHHKSRLVTETHRKLYESSTFVKLLIYSEWVAELVHWRGDLDARIVARDEF